VSPGRGPALAAIGEVTERAARSASDSLAATLVVEAAGRGDRADGSLREAARAVEMLEGALGLHDELLESRPRAENGHRKPVAAGVGGAWLLGRATERASALGNQAAAMWGEAANGVVRARILAFEDLYDAGRAPARYLTVAEMRTGGVFSLAARLGASISRTREGKVAALGEYGRGLGVAAEIRDDVKGMRTPDGRAAIRVSAGDYPLPLLYAIESDPELAGMLGKPLDAEALGPVLERVRAAAGTERAIAECRRRALVATGALDGLHDVDALVETADGITRDPVETPE
jgi:geranylgeranyl diphosphate synthase, type I